MPRKSSISYRYRMMAEEKEDISPLQEDLSYDILNSNKSLVNITIDDDRTYYYSNQDYKGISKEIDKNDPIDYDINNIALFVGEGNIFNLLPTLSKYVSEVIVIDRDDKLINYKRNELKAFIESDSVDEYYSSLFRYMGSFYPAYITLSKDFALMGLEMSIGFKQLTEDCFLSIKEALMKVNVKFLQIDVMNKDMMKRFGDALIKRKKRITIVNRTNLMEYGTPHMQIKIFKKLVPELENILDNFEYLPIHYNSIVLFGISLKYPPPVTYVVKGWHKSIIEEIQAIENNRQHHIH